MFIRQPLTDYSSELMILSTLQFHLAYLDRLVPSSIDDKFVLIPAGKKTIKESITIITLYKIVFSHYPHYHVH